MSRDFSRYDFTKFDPNLKYNLYIDSDTIAYASAAKYEKEPCVVTHKASRRKKEFTNFGEFENFLATDERGSKFTLNDFDVPVIGFALKSVKNKVEAILDHTWVGSYKIYIQGKDNFRYGVFPEYKSNRGAKPTLHKYCFNYMLSKYKGNIEVVNGYESEDFVIADAYDDPLSVRCYIDKDLETQSGYFLNYNHLDKGVFYIDKLQAFYNLSKQLLTGDSTDFIRGVGVVAPQLKEKFGIRTKSVGVKTAELLLEDVKHDKISMKERVVEVYKLSFGEDWKQALDVTGKLIFITKKRGEIFNLETYMRGVSE